MGRFLGFPYPALKRLALFENGVQLTLLFSDAGLASKGLSLTLKRHAEESFATGLTEVRVPFVCDSDQKASGV